MDWATEVVRTASRPFIHRTTASLWRRGWMWWTLLNLGIAAVMGARILGEPAPPVMLEGDRYQAYDLEALPEAIPLHDARRFEGVLIMTVEDAWFDLNQPDRVSLIRHLRSHLLGKDGIEELVLVDPLGRQVASAAGARIVALPWGR